MKSNKIKMKTQDSLEKIKALNQRKENQMISYSNYRKKNKIITPTRFADISLNNKITQNDSFSTNDQQSSNYCRQTQTKLFELDVNQAIDILKEISSKNINKQKDQTCKITPFQLNPNQQLFQEELSFKGASNKINLLRRIKQIQIQISDFMQNLQSINNNKYLNLISQRVGNKGQKQNLRQSCVQFYNHLESITKMINEFVVQLNRCKMIMDKISTGISQKTMNSYIQKFQILIAQIQDNINYLQNYMMILSKINKIEGRNMIKLKFKYPKLINRQYRLQTH